FDGGDGITSDSGDPVDVGASVGDSPGDGGYRPWRQGMTENGDVAASTPPRLVVAGARLDLDVHRELTRNAFDGLAQPRMVSRRRDENSEQQPAAEYHLLDIQDVDRKQRQGVEDRCRH